MAEALVIEDTSWSGPAASYMITRAVVGADTIQKGCIYVEDGIRKSKTIPRIEVSNFMQKRAATPVSKGTVVVDGRVLTPLDLMLYYEFNPRDYESHFYAEQLEPKLLGRELPVTAENFMMMQTMKRLNEFFENATWRSRIMYDTTGANVNPVSKGDLADAANYFYFDGLIQKAIADASTILVPDPAPLTGGATGNIYVAFNSAYALVPKALLYKYGVGGIKLMVSYPDQQKYESFLTEAAFKNNDTTEKGINRWKGYEVVPLAGLPENTFLFCIGKPDIDSNLWIGINSTEDNQLELAKLQPNSEMFFVKGLFKMDTQIGFTDQLVVYTTITE